MVPPTFLMTAAVVSGLLVAVERRGGRRPLWLVAGGAASTMSAFVLARDYPYLEVAPIGLVLLVSVPVLLAALIARAGRQWHWLVTWAAATSTAAEMAVPAYMAGCIVSDRLPVPGCFF